jgi:hypothetical protein
LFAQSFVTATSEIDFARTKGPKTHQQWNLLYIHRNFSDYQAQGVNT